ncbi:BQ2448_6961 [Microbotryum intermedium]|uniref:BQ2448_6961 protein n=1 Tax=Microbotryum intermedium TaxID=269621 RepID=A0A238FPL5_9BASI|nr:BQ2448_6961 [Microbotryum intermedium]
MFDRRSSAQKLKLKLKCAQASVCFSLAQSRFAKNPSRLFGSFSLTLIFWPTECLLPLDSTLPNRSVSQKADPTQVTQQTAGLLRNAWRSSMIKARRSSRLVLATAWQLATSTAAARSTRSTPLLQSHPAAAEVVGNNPLARATAPAPARAPDDDLAAVREPAFKARPHQPQRRHERLSPLSPSPPTPTTAPSRSGFLSDLAPGLSDGPAVLAPVDPHMKAALRTRASQRQSQPEVVVLSPDLASASTSLRPSSPPPLGDKLPHAPALPLIEPTSSSVHHVKQSDASSHGAPDVQCLGKPTGPQSPPGPDQQAIDDWASSVRPQREPSLLATHSDNSSGGSDASPSHMTSASLDRLGSAPRMMKASKVPASQLGRLLHYGGLAAGLGFGAASEAIKRVSFGAAERDHASSLFMSEANVRRLVDKLSRMRGAALKLGQFMSIQDTKILPDQVEDILKRVQNSANYMPFEQTEVCNVQQGATNQTNACADLFPPLIIL